QFHSFGFIFFFIPVAAVGYVAWSRLSGDAGRIWLVISSLAFYCWGEPRALPVFIASILFNYWIARGLGPEIAGSGRRLRLALAANILALVVFKYTGFLSLNANAVFGTQWSIQAMILPLGISFFTVQQIIMLVDRHQGIVPKPRFIDYALFVSWFPYIVAGPITRWKEVVPQFPEKRARLRDENLARGTALFIFGLSKKVILATAFGHLADTGFANPAALGFLGAWLATAGFALELYFDFSGYTDMARGASLLFNIALPENFDNPFRSLSITEFWQRWHITLTRFITNYMYTPILRARRPTFTRALWATIAAMTIAGIWHGAAWGYAIFGLWHGVGLAANTAWRKYGRPMPGALAWCLTAAFVLVGFAFFRAHTIADALTVVRSMFIPARLSGETFVRMTTHLEPTRILFELTGFLLLFYPATASTVALENPLRLRMAGALAVCLFVCLLSMNSVATTGFIYRQF
ncbi:MAG: MBOAT family O-acyltransferase, partial [Terriglobia bacterium]